MIEKVTINGLPSYGDKLIELNFNKDINIITGVNGQGKTTLLKLIWYIYSGNLRRATNEIEFDFIHMVTDTHEIQVVKCSKEKMNLLQMENGHSGYDIRIYDKKQSKVIIDTTDLFAEVLSISYCSEIVSKLNDESLYFPTFRQIEGFPSKKSSYRDDLNFGDDEELLLFNTMKKISNRMSMGNHKYITSVSTKDINELITNKYAEISEIINNNYISLSDSLEKIIDSKENSTNVEKGQLNAIKELLEENKEYRNHYFRPIHVINDVVAEVFKRKGVKINNTISFGEQKQIIDSDYLSAGEKQMLSFIAYNALYSNSPIIIDEPEISLHVDWQRKILKILTSQNTGNQLIIATHSPFIYSKYSDKEIIKDFDTEVNKTSIEKNETKLTNIDLKDFIKTINTKHKDFDVYE
ncbi:AAA family ATPase [Paenibacillus sp. 1781tsa1]|uniref:AAA family ATPase n=1 Tax=Paenibacillus sp. 1781tsa1 TaxID=2953810 RepID=UPI00209C7178|nr:AAA family ATPase [Paenibacillus sp. 1781tsa1]MCP1182094.1 ATP-binding protein [Paenibacillus sp. 1781tsa1]